MKGLFEGKMLPELCMDLHMAMSGAAEPLDVAELHRAIGYIEGRLAAWQKPLSAKWDAFDNAVHAMCTAVVAEWRREYPQ